MKVEGFLWEVKILNFSVHSGETYNAVLSRIETERERKLLLHSRYSIIVKYEKNEVAKMKHTTGGAIMKSMYSTKI